MSPIYSAKFRECIESWVSSSQKHFLPREWNTGVGKVQRCLALWRCRTHCPLWEASRCLAEAGREQGRLPGARSRDRALESEQPWAREGRTQWPRSGAGAALAKGRRSVNVGRGVMAVSEKGVPRRWGSEGGRQGPVGVALARGAKACGCDGTGREAPRFPSVQGGPRSACSPYGALDAGQRQTGFGAVATGRGGSASRGRARRLRAVAAQLVFIVTERRVHRDEARSAVGRRLRGGLPAAPLLRPVVGVALHTRVRRLRPPATLRAGTETVNGLCKSGVFIANDWTLPGTGQGRLRTWGPFPLCFFPTHPKKPGSCS